MAWYPRKYHPDRHNDKDSELLEQLAPAGSVQEQQMRRFVHFDIDPGNGIMMLCPALTAIHVCSHLWLTII